MLRLACLLLIAATASAAVQIEIDQPREWANPKASHHGKHFLWSMPIGAAGYGLGRLAGLNRWGSWLTGTLLSAGAQVAYETRSGLKHDNLIDPVDVGYGTLGGAAGAAIAGGADTAVHFLITRDSAAIGASWSF